jgi:hypothetical protein
MYFDVLFLKNELYRYVKISCSLVVPERWTFLLGIRSRIIVFTVRGMYVLIYLCARIKECVQSTHRAFFRMGDLN